MGVSFYQLLEGFYLLTDKSSCDKITLKVKYVNTIFSEMSRGSFTVSKLTVKNFIRG